MSLKIEPYELAIMINMPVYYCDGCHVCATSKDALVYDRPDAKSAFTPWAVAGTRTAGPQPLPPQMAEMKQPGGATLHFCAQCLATKLGAIAS